MRPVRLAAQDGISLVEVVLTVLVVTAGILTTLGSFLEIGEASYEAQRKSAMVSIAQREMERIRSLPYESIGLAQAPGASAWPHLPPSTADEALVSNGVVRAGPDPEPLQGVSAEIFRFVTWRPQGCPLLKAKLASDLGTSWGQGQAAVEAALADLCPGTRHTKRVTVIVRATKDSPGPLEPIVLSSVVVDPDSSVLANGSFEGLRVDPSPVTQGVAGGGEQQQAAYETASSQTWYLYDTPCTSAVRVPTTADHQSHNTAGGSAGCVGEHAHDLMGEARVSGSITDPLLDLSTDVHRPLAGGLALRQDSEPGVCGVRNSYSDGDQTARGAIHTWATPAASVPFETPDANARATFTFWTQTAAGELRPGRLCFSLRRSDTGQVLGSTLHALTAWPKTPTQLAVAFDLAAADMPAGTRLLLTARNPSDGESDLILLYDHAAYQSSLSVTMRSGSELK